MGQQYKKIKFSMEGGYGGADDGLLIFKHTGVSDYTEVFMVTFYGKPVVHSLFGFGDNFGGDHPSMDEALVQGLTDWGAMEDLTDSDWEKYKEDLI